MFSVFNERRQKFVSLNLCNLRNLWIGLTFDLAET